MSKYGKTASSELTLKNPIKASDLNDRELKT